MRWVLAIAVAVLWVSRTHAAGIPPGPLTTGHEDLNTPAHCVDCHDGNGAVSSAKCVGCHAHEQLGRRIAAGEGYHASAQVLGKPCAQCHHDHKGRLYDPRGWATLQGGEQAFDHALAGWPLAGRHAAVDCASCHPTRDRQGLRRYTGADRRCEACHAQVQPHRLGRAPACDRCHDEAAWRPATLDGFDHGAAAMPLVGAHRKVACAACHPRQVYGLGAAKPAACDNAGCHRNVHTGHLFGARDCAWCHSPAQPSMKQVRFDHDSRLPIGRHSQLACNACHTQARGVQAADMACERCHAARSPHGDRFQAFGKPPRCATCHPATSWTASAFRHDTATKFSLNGHRVLACRACHRGSRPDDFEDLHGGTACKDCHAHRTVHADADHPTGKYDSTQCLNCHLFGSIPPRRPPMLNAVHGVAGTFPLVRGHKEVPCADCHVTRSPKGKMTFSELSPQCAPACHADLHRGSLGARCRDCHVPGIWGALAFDHDRPFPAGGRVAGFALRGRHREVACEACHPARDFAAAGTTCAAAGCHGADDAHQGHLGKACERCHTETGDNQFDHATSRFPLDGKHRSVPCGDCHASTAFTPRPRACAGCHPVPAFHRTSRSDLAWYDDDCGGCHTPRGW
jgi:hypothetical protein